MAEAAIRGILKQGLVPASQIIASGPREERGRALHTLYGIETTTDNLAVAAAETIVLSVKPQTMPIVLAELHGKVEADRVILSIAAGIRMATLAKGLDCAAIARAMPNTPGQINAGITVWTCMTDITREQRTAITALLGTLGETEFVTDEKYIDIATALSGSAPAYTLLLIEALIDAGVHCGMQRPLAERLSKKTILGSALYADSTDVHVAQLRNEVTSPAGTTAEALYELEKAGFRTAIDDAVRAAFRRCIELGGGK